MVTCLSRAFSAANPHPESLRLIAKAVCCSYSAQSVQDWVWRQRSQARAGCCLEDSTCPRHYSSCQQLWPQSRKVSEHGVQTFIQKEGGKHIPCSNVVNCDAPSQASSAPPVEHSTQFLHPMSQPRFQVLIPSSTAEDIALGGVSTAGAPAVALVSANDPAALAVGQPLWFRREPPSPMTTCRTGQRMTAVSTTRSLRP